MTWASLESKCDYRVVPGSQTKKEEQRKAAIK